MTVAKAALTKPSLIFVIIFVLQGTLWLSIALNIAVAQQVIGFVYLTFVPGFILLKLLKINNLSLVEASLLSVGLSVTVLILVGLAASVIGPQVGVNRPLDLTPLIIIISCFVVAGCFLCNFKGSLGSGISELTRSFVIKCALSYDSDFSCHWCILG